MGERGGGEQFLQMFKTRILGEGGSTARDYPAGPKKHLTYVYLPAVLKPLVLPRFVCSPQWPSSKQQQTGLYHSAMRCVLQVPVSWQQVDCNPPGNIVAKVVDSRSSEGGFIAVALESALPSPPLPSVT